MFVPSKMLGLSHLMGLMQTNVVDDNHEVFTPDIINNIDATPAPLE